MTLNHLKSLLFSRCLCGTAAAKFKEVIPSALNKTPCLNTTEDSFANFTPSQIDRLVDSAAGSQQVTLNSITSLKKGDNKTKEGCLYGITLKLAN